MKEPRLTVITVTLNAGEALLETVASVLAQETGEPFEYLVQDGGSSDGTIERLPDDPRLRVVIEKDAGIYDAMNRAAGHARGTYLNFLNAGDRFPRRDSLSLVAGALDGGAGDLDLLYGDFFDERSAKVRRAPAVFGRRALFLGGICHQAQWIRRETFLALGGFDLGYRFRADHELLLRLAEAGANTLHLPETLALYDGRGFSAATGNRAGLDAEWSALRSSRYTPGERFRWGLASAARLLWLKRLLLDLSTRLFPRWLEKRRQAGQS